MPAPQRLPAIDLDDEELVEHLASWAEALRGTAARWRFRAHAGRVGAHTTANVLRVAERLDVVADLLVSEASNDRRRDAPDLLEQSEDRFRLFVDTVRDYAMFLLDPDGQVASWNAGAERIYGFRADEVVGRHFSVFYPETGSRADIRGASSRSRCAPGASTRRAGAFDRTARASGRTCRSRPYATRGARCAVSPRSRAT